MDDRLARLQRYLMEPTSSLEEAAPPGSRAAAVLIPLCRDSGGLSCILTRRSEGLPTHAGQISFPGGTREKDDISLLHTALRETEEEIGLSASALQVLGQLPALTLPSGFHVTPFVALCDPLPALRPEPAEVAEIFTLPLSLLLHSGTFQHGSRHINNIKRDFYYIDFKDYYIWGATAAMLRELARCMAPEQF